MKTRLCFRAYPRLLPAVLALGLVGCNVENTSSGGGLSACTSGFTFEDPSEVTYDSLTIDRDSSTNPENAELERTLFRNFARITQPGDSPGDGAAEAYDFFKTETETFVGFDASELPDYSSVRNGFDLLEAMIASGNVAPLQTARNAMANCVREDAAGSLRINSIQVTETPDEGKETSWELGVNYAHNPEPLEDVTPFGPNIARVASTPESFVFTLYPNQSFKGIGPASGFKQPTKLIAGFNAGFEQTVDEGSDSGAQDEGSPTVLFESFLADTQDDRGVDRGETDRWSWSASEDGEGTEAFSAFSDELNEAKCVRITANYSDTTSGDRILVELDEERCRDIDSPADFEPADTFSYPSKNPATGQRRD